MITTSPLAGRGRLVPAPAFRVAAALLLLAATAFDVSPLVAQTRPAPPPADTVRLSLGDAVETALRTSDEVMLASAQTEVADAQVTVARASALPQLRINSTYNRAFESARANAVGQLFNQPETYTATLNVSQSLFQGGRLRAANRAATSARSASRLEAEETRAVVGMQVQRAYLGALLAERVVAIQAGNVALAAARVEQVEQLQRAGRAARYDLLRARVERANLEPLLIDARNARELALLDLKRLLNLPVERPLTLTTTIDSATAVRLADALSGASGAADRPAVRAAEEDVRARREGVRVARADLLPTVGLSFQSGFQAFPPRGSGFPTTRGFTSSSFCANPTGTQVCQNGGWFEDRSAGLTISIPVFDGLRAKGNIDLAQAQQQLAEVQLRQTRERVTVEVASARAELERARSDFAARGQTTAEAREAFELATLRFSRGLSTQLEVSDAQLALLTAQTGEARATVDLYLAAAELARALGRPLPLP
ncbi:MAG TPA: TolC family protein [Gemmatimonadaceae bacterium]|nr:TolC family protein [Gemmatimonadaceae bacterium]